MTIAPGDERWERVVTDEAIAACHAAGLGAPYLASIVDRSIVLHCTRPGPGSGKDRITARWMRELAADLLAGAEALEAAVRDL